MYSKAILFKRRPFYVGTFPDNLLPVSRLPTEETQANKDQANDYGSKVLSLEVIIAPRAVIFLTNILKKIGLLNFLKRLNILCLSSRV